MGQWHFLAEGGIERRALFSQADKPNRKWHHPPKERSAESSHFGPYLRRNLRQSPCAPGTRLRRRRRILLPSDRSRRHSQTPARPVRHGPHRSQVSPLPVSFG